MRRIRRIVALIVAGMTINDRSRSSIPKLVRRAAVLEYWLATGELHPDADNTMLDEIGI